MISSFTSVPNVEMGSEFNFSLKWVGYVADNAAAWKIR